MSTTSILIVEDEAIVADDLARKVEQLGYEVAEIAESGEDAVALALRLNPSLVLMDWFPLKCIGGSQVAKSSYGQHHCLRQAVAESRAGLIQLRGNVMNKRSIVIAAMLLLGFIAAAAAMAADDPFTGTWVLNAAKSNAPGGRLPHPRSTNVIEVRDKTVHLIADETDATGTPLHVEYTAVYDGKEYPVKQTPPSNESYTISIKRPNLHTVEWVEIIGKLTIKGQDILSEDGRSFSRTVNVKGADGHDSSVIQFFEKQ